MYGKVTSKVSSNQCFLTKLEFLVSYNVCSYAEGSHVFLEKVLPVAMFTTVKDLSLHNSSHIVILKTGFH